MRGPDADDLQLAQAHVLGRIEQVHPEELGVDRCAYANVDHEAVFDITGDYARGVPSIVGRWDVAAFGPGCVADMRAKRWCGARIRR